MGRYLESLSDYFQLKDGSIKRGQVARGALFKILDENRFVKCCMFVLTRFGDVVQTDSLRLTASFILVVLGELGFCEGKGRERGFIAGQEVCAVFDYVIF